MKKALTLLISSDYLKKQQNISNLMILRTT